LNLPIQRIALAIALIASCLGCGSDSSMAPVRGKVTLNGQPIAEGAIATLPKAGRGAQGKITNGKFVLGTDTGSDGALVGTHQVAVIAQEKPSGAGPEAKAGKLLVPQRYTDPTTSGLTIEVKAGETNTPTLDLKSP
jgi:hypothetical protein